VVALEFRDFLSEELDVGEVSLDQYLLKNSSKTAQLCLFCNGAVCHR